MGHQRYAPEFKDEAVRQVIERGHPVTQMAARLGVSSHSLYKWVSAVRPSKEEERLECVGRVQDQERLNVFFKSSCLIVNVMFAILPSKEVF